MASLSDDPQPSTSTQFNDDQIAKDGAQNNNEEPMCSDSEIDTDKELSKVLTVEDFLIKSKTYMLEYEKHMFMDTIDSDCLVVSAK